MKERVKSLPEKIRHVRTELKQWMDLRQQNPIMGRDHLQETAERESLRLAAILDALITRQNEQMRKIKETYGH